MKVYLVVIFIIFSLIIGIFIGFTIAKKVFNKQIKSNPLITKEQIRAMYSKMGRKPTETQINQILKTIKKD